MLRRSRHGGRRLRVELSAADDRDPARGSRRRRRARRARARHLHDALSAEASAAAGARTRRRHPAGAADRRARSRRRAVRSLSAGSPLRLSGHDPGARRDPRGGATDRRDHVEPHARDPRRDQAALPLSLGRLSGRAARARDHPPQMSAGAGVARARDCRLHAAAARDGPLQGAGNRRIARLGRGADRARPRRARPGRRSPTRWACCSSIRTTSARSAPTWPRSSSPTSRPRAPGRDERSGARAR